MKLKTALEGIGPGGRQEACAQPRNGAKSSLMEARVDGAWSGIWRTTLTYSSPSCFCLLCTLDLVQQLGGEVERYRNSEGWCSRTSSATNKLRELERELKSPTGWIPQFSSSVKEESLFTDQHHGAQCWAWECQDEESEAAMFTGKTGAVDPYSIAQSSAMKYTANSGMGLAFSMSLRS